MQEAEIHDLSDDADYAASQQQRSTSMMRCDSEKRRSSNEPEGAEIVYTKDNVTIHPTQFASERISGRLKLIKQSSSLFLTWIPYKGQSTNARLSEKDMNLYTIREVPFADVRCIRRHTPALGWQYIIVVLSSGLAFPPLYFYSGGVQEFLATVKQHVFLMRSAEDANVFLVNNFQNPLQQTLSSLGLPGAVSIACVPSTSVLGGESASHENGERDHVAIFDGSPSTRHDRRERQKVHGPARDISIQVLEKFSLVTKFARETTSQLLWESQNNSFSLFERINLNQSVLDSSKKPHNDALEVYIPVPSDPFELDELSLAWGKPRQPPLGLEEWATFLDSEGRVVDSGALRKRIFYGGVEHKVRKEVWKILLGYQAYESTYAERERRSSIKRTEYEIIKNQWQSISPEQEKRFTKFRQRKGLIEKDVVRTDRSISFYGEDDHPNLTLLHDVLLTYSFYNFDLGYCQLVELLDGPLHEYFKQKDCLNYFICFRWILLQFKRELEFEKTMLLWEVLWTYHSSEHLHLYVCVAILKRYRGKMMEEQMEFDTLLKFINELSGRIDIDAILRDAEALCLCAGENGVSCIPPGTPPSLPLGNDVLLDPELEDKVL
ncbi:TBC1 domain family member 15-like isoform X2 [Hibiscus syriacus]|uniref:TBC1 domain family member 15-like isoform X2 n=1 Tax=Hibiscus syriacus TaxID=106335 RepID=UPI001920A795|nr:TBC1 domain family member 15-like isoform X2 [Hibiscus syriacus]